MAARLLNGALGLGEAKVSAMIIIENCDTGCLVLANLVLWRNAAAGGQRAIVIANTIKWLDRVEDVMLLPEIRQHAKEVFIFFKDFIIDDGDGDFLLGHTCLKKSNVWV